MSGDLEAQLAASKRDHDLTASFITQTERRLEHSRIRLDSIKERINYLERQLAPPTLG